jgi:hypothetical protein
MLERVRFPNPERVLRVASLAVLAAVAASGLLANLGGIDLIDHLDWAPPCAIRAWIGFSCPGCGMTRALVLLGQFQFAASCSAHPAAPGFAIALAVGVVRPGLLTGRCRDVVASAALVFVGIAWLLGSVV